MADLDETDPENPIAADQGGGGGGGYLELCTRVPIATADRAKCTANGGAAGGASAGAGATGVVRFYSV